jgi:hypothetical protein
MKAMLNTIRPASHSYDDIDILLQVVADIVVRVLQQPSDLPQNTPSHTLIPVVNPNGRKWQGNRVEQQPSGAQP